MFEHLLNRKHVIIVCVGMDHKQPFSKQYVPCLYMQVHLEANKYRQGAPPNSS
jgi:hypothetical protein